jgi:hypothetical protein
MSLEPSCGRLEEVVVLAEVGLKSAIFVLLNVGCVGESSVVVQLATRASVLIMLMILVLRGRHTPAC